MPNKRERLKPSVGETGKPKRERLGNTGTENTSNVDAVEDTYPQDKPKKKLYGVAARAAATGIGGPGRPKGSRDKFGLRVVAAIIDATIMHGMDGKGKKGMEGYFYHIARTEPKVMGYLLGRILPQKIQTSIDPDSVLGQLLEATRARISVERARTINATPTVISPPNGKAYSNGGET